MRKKNEAMWAIVKDQNVAILVKAKKLQKSLTEYIERLLNVDEKRETEILTLGVGLRGS